MPYVSKITGEEFKKGPVDLITQVANFFRKHGNLVKNSIIGDVIIDKRGVKSDIGHGMGRKKAASFAAVPDVIKKGKIVDYQSNWKNRGYDTVVLAAPIKIGKTPHIMGVVLIKDHNGNRFYLHEVLSIGEGAMSFKTGTVSKNGESGDTAPSLISILQRIAKINPLSKKNISQIVEGETESKVQAVKNDIWAKEHIKEYGSLNALNKSAVRATIRAAQKNNMSEQDIITFARFAAKSALSISFDKTKLVTGIDEDGNTTYANGKLVGETLYVNPESKLKYDILLVHEMFHKLFREKASWKLIKSAIKHMDAKKKREISARYEKYYKKMNKGELPENFEAILIDEIAAHYTETVFSDIDVLAYLTEEQPTIKDKIIGFFNKSARTYADDSNLSSAARKFARQYRKLFQQVAERDYQSNSAPALALSVENGEENPVTNINQEKMNVRGEERYSFAGKKAKTADKLKLATAEQMLKDGIDSETVRKETGWFKGYDGKWRFEIDDSQMVFSKNGFNPDLLEYKDLELKFITGTITDEEQARLQELSNTVKGINLHRLDQFVKHDTLFEAYPELRGIELKFTELDGNEKGNYDYRHNEIQISNKLSQNEIKETLIHEIQHAVQHIEEFTVGSNLGMFNNTEERSAYEQYENTAGEIEARDVSKRLDYDADKRKNTRPDIDRSDVVFAENSSVSYFAKEKKNSEVESIRLQLINHLDEINKISPVANVNYEYTNKETAKKDAFNLYSTKGLSVDRKNFGIIELSEKEIKESSNYVNTPAEAAAWMTIPNVLKRGKIVSGHSDHKSEGFPTYTIAAPVVINGKTGIVGVVVKKTGKYRYKAHRILMPNGSTFVYEDINKSTEPTGSDILLKQKEKGPDISSVPNTIIPENSEKSKSFSKKSLENSSEERLSLPEDIENIENFDISCYTEIKLNTTEQERIQSEALTWDAKHRNELRTRTLSNGITYRYVIDDDGIVHVFEREKAKNIHEWREDYGNTNTAQPDRFIEKLRSGYGNDSIYSRTLQNRREQAENDRLNNTSLRPEGRSNGAGYSENWTNANRRTQKGVQEENSRVEYHPSENINNNNEKGYNYSKEQYESFGWASEAGGITTEELDDLFAKIKAKSTLRTFRQSSKGEAIIEVNNDPHKTLGVNNVFVFVKGTRNNFYINRVVRFSAETETEMEIIKEALYERGTCSDTYLEIYKKEGITSEYRREDSATFAEYRERRSNGKTSGGINTNNRIGTERGRNNLGSRGNGKTENPLLKVVHTFTDLTGKKRNVVKIDGEYMIEGDGRSKYQPTIEAAVEAENKRIIIRYAKKLDTTAGAIKQKLEKDPDFLKKQSRRKTAVRYSLPEDEDFESPTVENVAKQTEKDNSIKGRIKRIKKNFFTAKDRLYIDTVDEMYGIQKYLDESGDKNAKARIQQARASRSQAQTMIGSVQYDVFSEESKKIGDGIHQIMKPIRSRGKNNVKKFEDYMLHRLNIDRMTLEERSLEWTKADREALEAIKEDIAKREAEISRLEEEAFYLGNSKEDIQKKESLHSEIEALAEENRKSEREAKKLEAKIKERLLENKPIFGENENRASAITAEESRKIVEKYESIHPDWNETAEKIYTYLRALNHMRVEAGLITAEQEAYMNELYPHYVPAYRDFSYSGIGAVKGSRNLEVSKTVKKAKGGGQDISEFEQSIAEQTEQLLRAGRINQLANAIYESALASGDTDYVQIVNGGGTEAISHISPMQSDSVDYSFGVTQRDIDTYVDDAYDNKNTEDYKKYATVSNKLINDVKNEIDVSEYSHALRDNDIRHINNSHGEGRTNEKYPVTKQDIKSIPLIVEQYDKVIVFQKSSNKIGLMYVKVMNDGLVYYLEQITDRYGNEKLLINKQMIKTGIDDIPDIKGLKDAITKKQSETEFLADLKARQVYAQSVYQSHSANNSISENSEKINRFDDFSKKNGSQDDIYDAFNRDTEVQQKNKNNQITFYKDGEKITMNVSREIFLGFEALTKPTYEFDSTILNIAARSNRAFKKLVTSYNPAFAARNIIRDAQDAGLNSKHPALLAKNVGIAIAQMLKNSDKWQLYRAYGGWSSTVFDANGFNGEIDSRGFDELGKLLDLKDGVSIKDVLLVLPKAKKRRISTSFIIYTVIPSNRDFVLRLFSRF